MLLIARSTIQTNAKIVTAQSDVTRLQKEINGLNKRAEAIKTAMTPEQQSTLKSAHALVNRKKFSWSLLFADLEAALPGGVRVSRIVVNGVGTQDDRTIATPRSDRGQQEPDAHYADDRRHGAAGNLSCRAEERRLYNEAAERAAPSMK